MNNVTADIFLSAALNEKPSDWKNVVGNWDESTPSLSKLAQLLEFTRSKNRDYNPRYPQHSIKLSPGERRLPLAGFGIFEGRPTVVLSNFLASIFPEGTEHHDWAWEHGKPGNRSNEYIIGYRFPDGCADIPGVDELRRRAETDVKQLITEQYAAPLSPVGEHEYLGDRTATFSGPFDTHQNHWKSAVGKLARGKPFAPFIDDANAGIEEFPGLTEEKKPDSRFWQKKAERAGTLHPAQKKTPLLQFTAGASVVVGAMLFLHGVTTAWKLLRQPKGTAEPSAAISPGSSSRSAAGDGETRSKLGWKIAEAGAGAGLVLVGVVGLYGRER